MSIFDIMLRVSECVRCKRRSGARNSYNTVPGGVSHADARRPDAPPRVCPQPHPSCELGECATSEPALNQHQLPLSLTASRTGLAQESPHASISNFVPTAQCAASMLPASLQIMTHSATAPKPGQCAHSERGCAGQGLQSA